MRENEREVGLWVSDDRIVIQSNALRRYGSIGAGDAVALRRHGLTPEQLHAAVMDRLEQSYFTEITDDKKTLDAAVKSALKIASAKSWTDLSRRFQYFQITRRLNQFRILPSRFTEKPRFVEFVEDKAENISADSPSELFRCVGLAV